MKWQPGNVFLCKNNYKGFGQTIAGWASDKMGPKQSARRDRGAANGQTGRTAIVRCYGEIKAEGNS
jgi:hypothetical protein